MSVQMFSFGRVASVSLFAMLFGLSLATAAAPTLDTSFGVNGIVEQSFPDETLGGFVLSSLIQRDGRILASGRYVYGKGSFGRSLYRDALVRYDEDGSLDASFGQAGVLSSSPPEPAFLQRDGKIVGVGPTGLTRINSDGSPDAGFITDGAAAIPWFPDIFPGNLAQQADGKIIAFGTVPSLSGLVLVRFNTDGALDSTFNNDGFVLVPHGSSDVLGAALAIRPDGKLVIATSTAYSTARRFMLTQYYPDGTLDSKFGSGGTASATFTSLVTGTVMLVRQPDGRLIVAGVDYVLVTQNYPVHSLRLVGFTPTGQVDLGFGTGGTVNLKTEGGPNAAEVRDLKTQPDGKLLIVYETQLPFAPSQMVRVMRFAVDGAADPTFGNVGTLIASPMGDIRTIALQPNGDLVFGGTSATGDFALARFVSGPSAAIEYYNASLNHYFLSMNPQEVGDLDLGVQPGWVRTGLSFLTYGSAASATGTSANPVCRFHIPPQHGNSHFFSADPVECAIAVNKIDTDPNFSGYIEETSNAFYIDLPDKATGICPANTTPVYRLWNQAPASNHRYTTSVIVKDQMIANGWVAEGYGPNAIDMCAPQ
jgi:uncharacterized delta-60 repeat protein